MDNDPLETDANEIESLIHVEVGVDDRNTDVDGIAEAALFPVAQKPSRKFSLMLSHTQVSSLRPKDSRTG